MSISIETIEDDVWNLIYDIISNSSGVTSLVGDNVYAAYPSKFILEGTGMPFVIIERPTISEELVTINGDKIYPVMIRITNTDKKSEGVKKVSDAVRNALEVNKTITESNGLFDFTIASEASDFDMRDDKKIHYHIMNVHYVWMKI